MSSATSNKHFKKKVTEYSKSKNISDIRDNDRMEETSRKILLAGQSKSDDEEETSRVLSHEEKRKIISDINRLSQKMLSGLIELISDLQGNLITDNQDAATIDFERMSPFHLREISKYVSSCVKRLPRPKQIQNIPVTDPNAVLKDEKIELKKKGIFLVFY